VPEGSADALMSAACYRCGRTIDASVRIGRRESCLDCGADLRCCRNCRFYDPAFHNQCREPQAERQVEKERGNFCEYFAPGAVAVGAAKPGDETRAKLDALFRRKPSP
jgi:hypothetical protein